MGNKKQSKRAPNLWLVGGLAASVLVGAVALSQKDEVIAKPTVKTVELSKDYRLFDTEQRTLKSSPADNEEFFELWKQHASAGIRDKGHQTRDVVIAVEKQVVPFPANPESKNLEARLNGDLNAFMQFLPSQIRKTDYRVTLVSPNEDPNALPYSKDDVVQLYLVKSAVEIKKFTGRYLDNEFKLSSQAVIVGEVGLDFSATMKKNIVTFKADPAKIVIAPTPETSGAMRYTTLFNTVLSEYLHSAFKGAKMSNIKQKITEARERRGDIFVEDITRAIEEVNFLEEGAIHSAALLYLALQNEHQPFVNQLKQEYAGLPTHRLAAEFFDAMQEFQDNRLPAETKVLVPLNAWNQSALSALSQGKQGLITYTRNLLDS